MNRKKKEIDREEEEEEERKKKKQVNRRIESAVWIEIQMQRPSAQGLVRTETSFFHLVVFHPQYLHQPSKHHLCGETIQRSSRDVSTESQTLRSK